MSKRWLRLPSPALVLSMLALTMVLTGTSFAAGSVGTAEHGDKKADTKLVKKLAPSLIVRGAKVALVAGVALQAQNADTATTADSATTARHATSADSATNATNATNATHATTATSATNATTAATANALAGVQIVANPDATLSAGTQDDQVVTCPTGMVAIGGGDNNDGNDPAVNLNEVGIVTVNATDDSVDVFMNNGSGSDITWHAYAVCIHGSESGSS
jgi:hypothetical protein